MKYDLIWAYTKLHWIRFILLSIWFLFIFIETGVATVLFVLSIQVTSELVAFKSFLQMIVDQLGEQEHSTNDS